MFSVAVCDDDEILCTQLEKVLKLYENRGIETSVFYSGEKLYEVLSGGAHYDLIFLDIELKKLSGVDIGQKIREELDDQRVQIVYISAKQEYAMELFAVRPMNFLIKPFSAQDIQRNVEKAMQLCRRYESYFEFQIEKNIHRVKVGDILYFESKRRQIMLFTTDREYCFYETLNHIEKETDNRLLRLHRSYLVNPIHVREYQYDKVTLTNDTEIPISKPYRPVIREQLRKNWSDR